MGTRGGREGEEEEGLLLSRSLGEALSGADENRVGRQSRRDGAAAERSVLLS